MSGDDPARFRYLDLITASFVAVLLLSSVASTRIVQAGPWQFDGGAILFPLSHIFGDILTEVYGYARARRVIWTGFAWIAAAAVVLAVVGALPAVRGHELADARSAVLGQMPRFLIASLDAFRAGDFPSSKALARMQVRTGGRLLWLRRARSTAIGPGVDAIFLLGIALWGVLPQKLLAAVFASSYVSEVGVENLLTPATWPASQS